MQAYLFILLFFAAGILGNRLFANSDQYIKYKPRALRLMNLWIIRLALPALILLHVPKLEMTSLAIVPALVAWAWAAISLLFVFFLAQVFAWRREITGAMLLLVPLGNTSFIGYPMTLALFNETVLSYAIFLDQFGSFIMLSTIGTVVLAVYAHNPKLARDADAATSAYARPALGQLLPMIIFKVVTFAPFIALMFALLLPIGDLLSPVQPLLKALGASLMPLALLVVGAQFEPKLVREQIPPLAIAMGLKMLLAPLLVWLVLNNFHITKEITQASVFEMAMPAMMTPGIMAMQANLAPRFCASLLGYSTLMSMFTLPLVAFVLEAPIFR